MGHVGRIEGGAGEGEKRSGKTTPQGTQLGPSPRRRRLSLLGLFLKTCFLCFSVSRVTHGEQDLNPIAKISTNTTPRRHTPAQLVPASPHLPHLRAQPWWTCLDSAQPALLAWVLPASLWQQMNHYGRGLGRARAGHTRTRCLTVPSLGCSQPWPLLPGASRLLAPGKESIKGSDTIPKGWGRDPLAGLTRQDG